MDYSKEYFWGQKDSSSAILSTPEESTLFHKGSGHGKKTITSHSSFVCCAFSVSSSVRQKGTTSRTGS
jgi:hypothetical protein